MKRIVLVTGPPGIGKTTIVLGVADALRKAGVATGGMLSREVLEGGVRVGFEVLDLSTGRKGWLARVGRSTGPRVGKYRVDLEGLEEVGAKAIAEAVERSNVVVVDEVGPMELFSQEFKRSVEKALRSQKSLIGSIHWRARDPLIEEMRSRPDARIHEVTVQNRGRMVDEILKELTLIVLRF